MVVKTRAIVLHHVKYGESGIIMYCYTEEFGRMAYMVHGVRKKRSKFPGAVYQPLTILDVIFYYKANRSIQLIKELSHNLRYNSIPFNTTKSCIAMFISEVLYKTLQEEESNPLLFEFLYRTFHVFDLNDQGTNNFHLVFLLQYTKYLGIFPSGLLDKDKTAGHADLHVFSDLKKGLLEMVARMLQEPELHPDEAIIDNEARSLILERIIKYYNLHLEGILNLKSLSVLREIFN